MRPHPMEVIYRATVHNTESGKVPVSDFSFGFRYPSEDFSKQSGIEFGSSVQWVKETKALIVTTLMEDITLEYWEGLDGFIAAIGAQVEPYLRGTLQGGSLGAVPVGEGQTFHQVIPAFQFTIVCARSPFVKELAQIYSQLLYDRAALALWLSRQIFIRVASGERLNPEDLSKFLAREYGAFVLSLVENEENILLPSGLYENCYGRGLDKLQ